MAIYIGWFHSLHSNSLNTIHIDGCVNPCLEFEIWGKMEDNSMKHLHKELSIDVPCGEVIVWDQLLFY